MFCTYYILTFSIHIFIYPHTYTYSMRKPITLSLPAEYLQWLKAHPAIIPSHILQQEIARLMQAEQGAALQSNAELTRKIEVMQERLQKIHNFVDKKGLIEEFFNSNAS